MVQIKVRVYEAHETPTPITVQLQQLGVVEFRPVLSGPAIGEYAMMATPDFGGWQLNADNGKVVRFALTEVYRVATREIYGLAPGTNVNIGSAPGELIKKALSGNDGKP